MDNNNKSISINELIINYKFDILNLNFYTFGLLIGVIIYSNTKDKFNEVFNSIFILQSVDFKNYLIHYLIIYISIYLLIVLFSYSFIGNIVLYFAPVLIGIELAIRLSYYYSGFSIKGVGYSLLLIIPEAALFLVTVMLATSKGIILSKTVTKSYKKAGISLEINLKSYLLSFLKYLFLLIIICLINSGLYCALSSLITL